MVVSETSTKGNAPFTAFEPWMDAVGTQLAPCVGATERSDVFRGGLHGTALGAVGMFGAGCTGGVVISRTPKTVRQCDPEFYVLRLQLDGDALCTFDDDDTLLVEPPGYLSLSASSQVLRHTSDSERDEFVSLLIPYHLMPLPYDRIRPLTHDVLPTQHGVGAMLATMLSALPRRQPEMRMQEAIRVAGVIVDLLSTTVAERLDEERRLDPGQRDRVLVAKAKAFIDRNLHLPELSPTMVAAACAVSPRQLSRLFEGEGVAGWIRGRRLERVRRDLCDPSLDQLSIEHVGSRHGFVYAAHTSRLFKAAYGVTPGEFRRTWRGSSYRPAPDVNTDG